MSSALIMLVMLANLRPPVRHRLSVNTYTDDTVYVEASVRRENHSRHRHRRAHGNPWVSVSDDRGAHGNPFASIPAALAFTETLIAECLTRLHVPGTFKA